MSLRWKGRISGRQVELDVDLKQADDGKETWMEVERVQAVYIEGIAGDDFTKNKQAQMIAEDIEAEAVSVIDANALAREYLVSGEPERR